MSGSPSIVIIGSGFSGIGMAIRLKKSGFHDFVVLEKSEELGGTWHDNTYPGCACDVPSPMYSYSFELNKKWSRLFSPQPEIHRYLQDCAVKYNVRRHVRFGVKVESMEFDDEANRWNVITSNGVLTPKAIVSGVGGLHVPKFPVIPGLETFEGKAFHSAQWDHSYDLKGKRVAVIGTGASAIQFVPEIAKSVGRMTVFQRTPPWIQPKPDIPLPKAFRFPGVARVVRNAVFWILEGRAVNFAIDPRLSGPQKAMALKHLDRQIPDPVLRAKLTPDYTIGCKRILLSNNYYPALLRPNVNLVTDDIVEVRQHSVVTADGSEYEVDAIIFGTGFKVVDGFAELHVTGRDGLKLQDVWEKGIEAHHGITVPGFPNYFMLLGPNTALGHSSVVFMIEVQINHIMSCLKLIADRKADTIEPRPEAMRAWNDKIQKRLRKSVWNEGGCKSWYLDENGVNRTIWPGFCVEYWADTRKAKAAEFVIR